MASLAAVVALGAVGLFLLAVGTAPAGNRTPTVTFDDFPGPDEVTFGKNVAYTTSLQNTESSNYTHVFFRMPAPTTKVSGATLFAQLVYASCEPTRTSFPTFGAGDIYECPEIASIPAGSAPVRVTLVWRTPTVDTSSLSCSNPAVTDCVLTATGAWAIKENQPGSNDTFPVPTDEPAELTTLLLQPDEKKSGGYALNTVSAANCNTTTANLVTNLSVGATNKIATAVCASTKPTGDALNPGLVIEIDEGVAPYGGGFTDMSSICIPDPGLTCPVSIANTWDFTTPATHIFKIPEVDFPKGEKLDTAYHNGVLYTDYPCTFVRDNKTKIWTVTCPTDENGDWRFG
jgi:hypothetical protein